MQPPVSAVIEAHRTLERLVASLSDQQVVEASALPGWSRGHVLAHLTDNARMFARLAEHALRGELVAGYDGGVESSRRRPAAARPSTARSSPRIRPGWRHPGHAPPTWTGAVR
ncbi:maleylpyruvate isomerase N-terminal domain-containing protein [Streptomyces umbrinus]|uniref:maleylpyruvate isomerase N-terminal domain-containing protein n=1 Tax=Streptomyces umbrinus TaxID=67370 RepID=UPI003C2B1640